MMRKYGTGRILPDDEIKKESAESEWTAEDEDELVQENESEDSE